ncbi:MAG: ATP-binding cassette domain-containing protein, partial [Thermoplasmata archaeon]|nr:ATP-binding cassette domain-containing protein [Thermoplasmata archaeon]
MTEPILSVDGVTVDYHVGAGTFHALRNVTFDIWPGRVVGIVGETGCGKSTLAHSIPRLLPEPPAEIVSGRIVFRGVDLLKVPKWQMPGIRGTGISMIFQEPINSLNPAFRVFDQIAEAIRIRKMREAGKG